MRSALAQIPVVVQEATREFIIGNFIVSGLQEDEGIRKWKAKKHNPNRWRQMVYTSETVNLYASRKGFKRGKKRVEVLATVHGHEMNWRGRPEKGVVARPFMRNTTYFNRLVLARLRSKLKQITQGSVVPIPESGLLNFFYADPRSRRKNNKY